MLTLFYCKIVLYIMTETELSLQLGLIKNIVLI
jgi:hypothetical protein